MNNNDNTKIINFINDKYIELYWPYSQLRLKSVEFNSGRFYGLPEDNNSNIILLFPPIEKL